tara:strand:+ start:31775 stop:32485 length:711 start_codon:yes stop_codon:yes gene_type:complete
MKLKSKLVRGVAVTCAAALVLSGCVTTHIRNIDKFPQGTEGLKLLFMPIDVELSEVGASGIQEPKAEWTEKARKNLISGIKQVFSDKQSRLVSYAEPTNDQSAKTHTQLIKLHYQVGFEMMNQMVQPLPTKGKDQLKWTLGPQVQKLREASNADYALFVVMRDSYASAGRVAAIAVAAIVFGVGLPGGIQVGFASLVDLKTGEVVWFNRVARGDGDLRTPDEAKETIKVLMKELPS